MNKASDLLAPASQDMKNLPQASHAQRHEIFTNVQDVMGKVFGVPPEQIKETTKPEDIKRWDSMALLSVLLGLERRLGRKIPFGLLLAAASVGAIVTSLTGVGG